MYLIYDCEIVNCIPEKDGSRLPGLTYCDGWHDHANMGISVVGWATPTRQGIVFWDDPAQRDEFKALIQGRAIVGFNSRSFDDRLLAANGCSIQTHYDLLEECRIAAGFGREWNSVPRGYSYSLDAIARANGMAKTGSGASAPVLWQQRKFQEVANYCQNDVSVTHALLQLGWLGKLRDPNTGDFLELAPLNWES